MEVFDRMGLNTNRSLARDVADFYVLERLSFDGWAEGSRLLSLLEEELSREYLSYLRMVLGGEARHIVPSAQFHGSTRPEYLKAYLEACENPEANEFDGYTISRKQAWVVWVDMHEAGQMNYADSLPAVIEAFDDTRWKNSSAGGPMWASVARVADDFQKGRIKRRIFVDRCFTLEHNNGCVFDKVYKVEGLKDTLQAQATVHYDQLATMCSKPVKRQWFGRRRWLRRDYDPAWLGVQDVESFDDARA
jgi:hypothetical protein